MDVVQRGDWGGRNTTFPGVCLRGLGHAAAVNESAHSKHLVQGEDSLGQKLGRANFGWGETSMSGRYQEDERYGRRVRTEIS